MCVVRQWHVTDAAAGRWRRYQALAAEASRAEPAAAPGSHGGPAPAAEPGRIEASAAPDGLNGRPGPVNALRAWRRALNQADAALTLRAMKRRRVEPCLRETGAVDFGAGAPCEVHDTVGAVCVGPRGAATRPEPGMGCPHMACHGVEASGTRWVQLRLTSCLALEAAGASERLQRDVQGQHVSHSQ